MRTCAAWTSSVQRVVPRIMAHPFRGPPARARLCACSLQCALERVRARVAVRDLRLGRLEPLRRYAELLKQRLAAGARTRQPRLRVRQCLRDLALARECCLLALARRRDLRTGRLECGLLALSRRRELCARCLERAALPLHLRILGISLAACCLEICLQLGRTSGGLLLSGCGVCKLLAQSSEGVGQRGCLRRGGGEARFGRVLAFVAAVALALHRGLHVMAAYKCSWNFHRLRARGCCTWCTGYTSCAGAINIGFRTPKAHSDKSEHTSNAAT
jgi:hypothetical protein